MTDTEPGPRIVLFSDDVDVREEVRLAVGPRLDADSPDIRWAEAATPEMVIAEARGGDVDLFVLDAEVGKLGGMGVARQLKDEIDDCAPVVVVIARPTDAWLASWSNAEYVAVRPLDPMVVHDAVVQLLDGPIAA
ncbi:MAG: hypothetical protein FWD11_01090 [Micrococcales bacterium]|nr:hypothetical protein [Micrococcales bacterium]